MSPYSGATMLLDFLNPVLDSRITFSRGTNATLVDSTGRLTYAPNNQVLRSEEFNDAAWLKNNATVIANAATAPDGTATADLMVSAVGTAITGANSSSVTFAAGSYIQSVYVKAATGIRYIQLLWTSGGVSANYANFDLQTGTVTAGTYAYASMTAVGDGWYRISMGSTVGAATGGMWPIAVPAAASTRAASYTGNGTDSFLIWGAQLEAVTYQTTPSTYVATTASAYYGPRFDYDPVTLAPRGLLIEEARTNLVTYSDDLSNAAWTKSNVTATTNVTVSPDGTSNADRIVASTIGNSRGVFASVTTTAVAHTISVFAKASGLNWLCIYDPAGSGAGGAWFNLSTGVIGTVTAGYTASIANFGNGWYRCSIVRTLAAGTSFPFFGGVDGDNTITVSSTTNGVFLYGAQLEAGSFATSYIPTVASTVTRNADVATMTGTNFSSWYNQSEGTIVADVVTNKPPSLVAVANAALFSDGTASNRSGIRYLTASAEGLVLVGGATQAQIQQAYTAGSADKMAFATKANDFAFSRNGALVGTDTSGTVPTVDRLGIGVDHSGQAQINGHVRTIAYFNTRLPNAQLQTLTAPSLATTLSLDFTTGSYNVGF
jgi:hypothetical protein